jgi:hypothetical protein
VGVTDATAKVVSVWKKDRSDQTEMEELEVVVGVEVGVVEDLVVVGKVRVRLVVGVLLVVVGEVEGWLTAGRRVVMGERILERIPPDELGEEPAGVVEDGASKLVINGIIPPLEEDPAEPEEPGDIGVGEPRMGESNGGRIPELDGEDVELLPVCGDGVGRIPVTSETIGETIGGKMDGKIPPGVVDGVGDPGDATVGDAETGGSIDVTTETTGERMGERMGGRIPPGVELGAGVVALPDDGGGVGDGDVGGVDPAGSIDVTTETTGERMGERSGGRIPP